MEMKKVEYTIQLTGSKLFDMVMYNTAKKLCADYPGLELDCTETTIRVHGELSEYWYEKYQEEMFGKAEQ